MTELELKNRLLEYLKGVVDSNLIEVLLGTADSANTHKLLNANGCLLIGSAGSPSFIPKTVPGQNLHPKVDYHQTLQIVITVGYLSLNDNPVPHDELVALVLNSVTNLYNQSELVNQISPVRISETRERDGAYWTQLYFAAVHRLKVSNHLI